MFKLFLMLVVAGATALAGVSSAQACGGCSSAPSAPATAKAPSASTATAQNGRQSYRRYSVAPGATTYRAPAMMNGRRSSSGPNWSASRKVLGF